MAVVIVGAGSGDIVARIGGRAPRGVGVEGQAVAAIVVGETTAGDDDAGV